MTTVAMLEVPFMREIQLRDAKANLSAVVDEAVREGRRSLPATANGKLWS
jgi:antitoxin (DNA-binding transcriptional repressor) of toxin-antitoxin stability system